MSVKGDWPRPCSVTPDELKLRHDYMENRISLGVFNRSYKILKKQGKIRRNGRVINGTP